MSRQITCMGSDTRKSPGCRAKGTLCIDLNRHHVGHAGHGAEQRATTSFIAGLREIGAGAQRAMRDDERMQRSETPWAAAVAAAAAARSKSIETHDEDLWRGPRELRDAGAASVALAREQ